MDVVAKRATEYGVNKIECVPRRLCGFIHGGANCCCCARCCARGILRLESVTTDHCSLVLQGSV